MRVVVSTLPGRPLDDLKKRDWPELTVEPLTAPEREKLIDDYLARFAKKLGAERSRRIAAAPQTGNGLYLSTLLNELRQFGIYEELDKRITWYLEAANPFELYKKVIERWEQDYGKPDPACENVVRESLVRLWAARRGLSETELLESLGTPDSPLPRALWSPLYLAASDALVNRGGLLTFAHDFLREAARGAYLPTESHQKGAHRTLADYFRKLQRGQRQLDELPWQCQESAEWETLVYLLAQPNFLGALWDNDEYEVKAYWTQIEAHSPWRVEQVYAQVIQYPGRDSEHAWRVGLLVGSRGEPNAAVHINAKLIEHFRKQGNNAYLLGALNNLASILQRCGYLNDAMGLYLDSARLCIELGNGYGVALSLANQASVLLAQGDLDGAMARSKEAVERFGELGNKGGASAPLGNQASILRKRGDLDGALAIYQEQERICRELGDRDGLSHALTGQGLILNSCGDRSAAMAQFKRVESICRELGNKDGLSQALGNQALISQSQGDPDGAMALYKEVDALCQHLGKKDGLRTSLGYQATILYARGDLDGAMTLHKEEERLCRELEDKYSLGISLGNQANILYSRGDLDRAMTQYKEIELLCRELGDDDGLGAVLGNQANILFDRGDRAGALALLKQSEVLFRKIGNPETISLLLSNQARMLSGIPERRHEARKLAAEALFFATRHGDQQLVTQAKRILFSLWSTY